MARGRQRIMDDPVIVRTSVPRDISQAIDAFVRETGVSKYAVLRHALIIGLAMEDQLTQAIAATPYQRKQR